MFTGIIKYQTKVLDKKESKKILSVFLERPKSLKLQKGQSLNIDGICSTVKNFNKNSFVIEYMPETRKKTTVNSWRKGYLANLEESLTMKNFIDGHIVQGHVDALGFVKEIKKEGESKIINIKVPKEIMKFISGKGSVSINGVSLTVTKTKKGEFAVALIPYSLKETNLGDLKKGDMVNIETDLIARYLYNFLKKTKSL